ncbi:LOW QUALITY PROTEIN: hypothetical protein TorRG33x02_011350 [Trema orientale]|uniref:Secreted protein n=1 Tax=Trema orientale TaxID=63057 RepID=A0A2P5FZ63_TREOI|nr:LOW QUALITY PROTEIN: hypothetical protein TorRG33x02_011350 [Trema orientale]
MGTTLAQCALALLIFASWQAEIGGSGLTTPTGSNTGMAGGNITSTRRKKLLLIRLLWVARNTGTSASTTPTGLSIMVHFTLMMF